MTPDRDDTTSKRGETAGSARVIPDDDDLGKEVVDTRGQDIGMVTEVEGDTMYVDPHPSLTEKIKSTLNWGSKNEEELPVSPDFVNRIEDRVVLDVERDEEYQDEAS